MPDDLKSKLDAHYDAIITRLRTIAPRETEELLEVIAARNGLLSVVKPHPDTTSLPYVYYDSVIEAILHWFEKRDNEPASVDEIKDGVLAGGLKLHSPRRELNVIDSIRFHTTNDAHGRLLKIGKLIQPK